MARQATKFETKLRIAKEITDYARMKSDDDYIVFAQARSEWERRCEGSFDSFVLELTFNDQAWIGGSYRGQQRHGRGFRGHVDKQFVKLHVW